MALVSIIMNCLNGERDLQEALDSVKAQTWRDYEIIFWDNGSTDRSAEIAQSFGPRLRYFRSSETVPLGAARNLALAQARGDYIAFLDCDDLWRPEKLAKQIDVFLKNPKVGLVTTDTEIFNGKRVLSRVFANARPQRGMVFSELMLRQWISMSSAMIRRVTLDQLLLPANGGVWFDEGLNLCEEADLFYRIAHDWELDYIDEPLTIWRVHGQNTTFKKFARFASETRRILAKHLALYPGYEQEHGDLVETLNRRADFQEAISLWRDGKNKSARQLVKPWLGSSIKFRLFWLASFLPGTAFDLLAQLYFALPARLRH